MSTWSLKDVTVAALSGSRGTPRLFHVAGRDGFVCGRRDVESRVLQRVFSLLSFITGRREGECGFGLFSRHLFTVHLRYLRREVFAFWLRRTGIRGVGMELVQ